MKQPRRIFRSSLSARTGRVGLTMLAWLGAVLGTAGLVMVGLSSNLLGRVQPGPERVFAEPGEVAVVDGDTLRIEGRVIRLAGVDAPGRGDICRGGTDCGGAATTALASLVRDRPVVCDLSGHDPMGRPYGACDANGTNLSRAMLISGWARAQGQDAAFANLELRARRQRAGLWADAGP